MDATASSNQNTIPALDVSGPETDIVSTHDVNLAWAGATIFTIGHSTRSQADFIELLQHYGVKTLIDVRTVPRSRHNPQFNADELPGALAEAGIQYVHLAALGGLRHGIGKESLNKGWRNLSFRGYADYMQTPAFADGVEELRQLARQGPLALMCAEAVPWRCHRSLIADALLVRGVPTSDIQSLTHLLPHKRTPFAVVDGLRITYPPESGEPRAESGEPRAESREQ